jgi:hypothetical protein
MAYLTGRGAVVSGADHSGTGVMKRETRGEDEDEQQHDGGDAVEIAWGTATPAAIPNPTVLFKVIAAEESDSNASGSGEEMAPAVEPVITCAAAVPAGERASEQPVALVEPQEDWSQTLGSAHEVLD